MKLNQGPKGADKFSFAIMRNQINHKYLSENIYIYGSNKNIINGVLIPCKKQYEIIKKINENQENEMSLELQKEKTLEKEKDEEHSLKNSGKARSLNNQYSSSKFLQSKDLSFSYNNKNSKNNKFKKKSKFSSSSLGTVLICLPNAGMCI